MPTVLTSLAKLEAALIDPVNIKKLKDRLELAESSEKDPLGDPKAPGMVTKRNDVTRQGDPVTGKLIATSDIPAAQKLPATPATGRPKHVNDVAETLLAAIREILTPVLTEIDQTVTAFIASYDAHTHTVTGAAIVASATAVTPGVPGAGTVTGNTAPPVPQV